MKIRCCMLSNAAILTAHMGHALLFEGAVAQESREQAQARVLSHRGPGAMVWTGIDSKDTDNN
jgi:hypothetical protein